MKNREILLSSPFMKKFAFKEVQFIKSASSKAGYPMHTRLGGGLLFEVAVAGRSNVGKSSLLNHLFGVKNLVKTSQKPGKTRLLNFFKVDESCVFCDLPGYGYAQVKEDEKDSWGKMIEEYLLNRDALKGVLFLLDVRRTPSEQDRDFFEWMKFHQIPLILVFTKWDKLSDGAAKSSVKKNIEGLKARDVPYVGYSVLKNKGRKELLYEIEALLNDSNE